MFARVSILSASGPYLDRPADFPRPPVTQTIIVTPLYGIFEFVSLAVRFRGASRRKGRFFRAHCARSNTATITRESETDRETRERVDEFVLLYGYISFSYVRPLDRSGTLLLRLYLSLRVGISALLDILYIYIYIYTHASFSELAFLLFIRGMAPFVSGWQSALDGCAANWWE